MRSFCTKMKPLFIFLCVAAIIVVVNCKHTFLGTNVQRPLLQHSVAKYGSYLLRKKIEYFSYMIPHNPVNNGKYIQGILAYDLTDTGASANVTEGGIGTNFVKLRMKSDRGEPLKFDIYIYA